ncbi:unnamed protein product, partial [Medioppia subpectinata]
FLAIEPKDRLFDFKDLKTYIRQRLAIDDDIDVLIDDIVVDDYLSVRIIKSDEVLVVRRIRGSRESVYCQSSPPPSGRRFVSPMASFTQDIRRSIGCQTEELNDDHSAPAISSPSILVTSRLQRSPGNRAKKTVRWVANGSHLMDNDWDQSVAQNDNSSTVVDYNGNNTEDNNEENGSTSDGLHERPKRARKPTARYTGFWM